MMSCALLASWAYVPEVSTSMYTACVWLRESVQPAAASAAAGSVRRNWRRFMSAPLSGMGALEIGVDIELAAALRARTLPETLGHERHHDEDVVELDHHPAHLPRHVAQHAQQQ